MAVKRFVGGLTFATIATVASAQNAINRRPGGALDGCALEVELSGGRP
jgi:hypothetical protein